MLCCNCCDNTMNGTQLTQMFDQQLATHLRTTNQHRYTSYGDGVPLFVCVLCVCVSLCARCVYVCDHVLI